MLIYVWSKVVCLFCFVLFVLMRSTELGCFRSHSWFSFESSWRGGVHGAWFHDVWTCSARVLEYWMISSLKIKLNRSWKFRRNWNVPFVLLERSWWAGFNGIYLVRFGFRMWQMLIFKWFLPLKIQINQVLEGKISWGPGNTWANGRGHPSICWFKKPSPNLFNYRLVLENEMEIEEKPNGGRETGNHWRKTWQILTFL